MNYVTPATVRALEWLGALVPELPHIYLTSSATRAIDKALRLIKCTRKEAQVAIGLAGGYYGHTARRAARSRDPAVHRGGPGHFAWPRVPHPAIAGVAATIAALRAAVAAAGGPTKVLGFVYELVQERTGRVAAARLRRRARRAAQRARPAADRGRDHDAHVPLGPRRVPVAGDRPRPRRARVVGRRPDRLPPHARARWFVATPLTLVSTWDGDELSLVRQHHQLRAARTLDVAGASRGARRRARVARGAPPRASAPTA